jgi:hypothetical protein
VTSEKESKLAASTVTRLLMRPAWIEACFTDLDSSFLSRERGTLEDLEATVVDGPGVDAPELVPVVGSGASTALSADFFFVFESNSGDAVFTLVRKACRKTS